MRNLIKSCIFAENGKNKLKSKNKINISSGDKSKKSSPYIRLKPLITAFIALGIITGIFSFKPAIISAETKNFTGSISAESAILIDSLSMSVLYEKNADKQLPMASTTKIMTVLLALESQKTAETVTVTSEAAGIEGSSLGLSAGDKISLYDLCAGMMLSSGNDAAQAAALYLSDNDISKFAGMMNARAKAIGMKSTNFVTPSGLDAEGHCSTARDMSLLAATAMKNYSFCTLASAQTARIHVGEQNEIRNISNHNRLLKMYPGVCGIKTGFTKKAGRCLVSAVKLGQNYIIAVTLNAPDDWNDHMKMYDYAITVMQKKALDSSCEGLRLPVLGSDKKEISAVAEQITLYLPDIYDADIRRETVINGALEAPVYEGNTIGQIVYYINGREIARSCIFAGESALPPEKSRSFHEGKSDDTAAYFKEIFFKLLTGMQ